MKKLLLGIGNDLRGDDAIGIRIVDHILAEKRYPDDVTIENIYSTGFGFLSYVYNFEKMVIVDSVQIADESFGRFWRITPDQIKQLSLPLRSTHGFSLPSLLDLGKTVGWENPKETVLFLVGIRKMTEPQFECSDELSAPLQEIIPAVSAEILKELNEGSGKVPPPN